MRSDRKWCKWYLPYSRLKTDLYVAIFYICVIAFPSVNGGVPTKAPDKIDECEYFHSNNSFSWQDYLVLGSMLVISCGIGVFYGFFTEKHKTSEDFLLGGSSMGTFPMAMSLAASFVTAVELLGNPAEMYMSGSQFWMICLAFIMVIPITSKLYLPVFMTLRLTSSYEYLSKRFNPSTRYLASALYIFQMVLYTSVAVYAPALALSKVTGLNVYLAVSVVYIVCIFYASQGGMKAVIIADTFQAGVLVGSLILIVYLGEKLVGGTGVVWSESYYAHKLEIFNFNTDPTIRHSFWSVVVGGTFYWLTMFCSNQASIQKYLSVEKIGQVRTALWTSCFGLIFIYTVNFYIGMILIANYKKCDPFTNGYISDTDEILPLYIITIMGHLKGVTGFFVAGIFAASLGTVASALNSLSAVTMQDFIQDACNYRINGKRGALCAKILSILYGAISFGLVFIVAQLGSVMQVAISFNGMVGGITLGLFSLGMFFPWANSKGAIFGSIISACLLTCMCIGQQITLGAKDENYRNEDVFILFRLSYIWYSAIGFFSTIILGLLASFVTGFQNPQDVDTNLLSPPVLETLRKLPDSIKRKLNIEFKPVVVISKLNVSIMRD
ncbi:sodium-coupled monocarboxylate transporter 2-like [Rhynchophorus ferrugineus]|uniref:sodium-coupled monocarboxylate transporter 2-like n=1 Tax=Rhynchophorus ferrugineus TaxID=354439 RepID=UPI003FCE25FF